jgi:hypothetical protein
MAEKDQDSSFLWLVIIFGIILLFLMLFFGFGYFGLLQRENTPGYEEDVWQNAWTGKEPFISLGRCSKIPPVYRNQTEEASRILLAKGITVAPELILAIFHAGEHHAQTTHYNPNAPWPYPPWQNPSNSSARGPFQILNDTWRDWREGLAKRGINLPENGRDNFLYSAIAAGYGLYSYGAKSLNPTWTMIARAAVGYCCGSNSNVWYKGAYLNRVAEAYFYFRECSKRNYIGEATVGSYTSSSNIACGSEKALLSFYSDNEIADKMQPNAEAIMRSKMVTVYFPLKNGRRTGVLVNKKVAATFQEVADRLNRECQRCIISISGFNWRSVRSDGVNPNINLSNHAFGIAVDIDASLAPDRRPWDGQHPHPKVVQIFKQAGFKWGGDFRGNGVDPMHFQFCK